MDELPHSVMEWNSSGSSCSKCAHSVYHVALRSVTEKMSLFGEAGEKKIMTQM